MEQPHNPGLSDRAWKKLHVFLAKVQIKYAKEIAELAELENRKEKKKIG